MIRNVEIDSEFQALIPAMQPDERLQLEANIVADGCRDPLVVWFKPAPQPGEHKCYAYDESKCNLRIGDGVWTCEHCEHNPALLEYVLVDGHNRYEICTRLGIEFDTVEMEFQSRDDAVLWICKNQFGRRNLTDYQRGVLALRMKPIVEAQAKAQQGARTDISPKSDESTKPIRTDDVVAGLANIGRNTLRKIEKLEIAAEPEVKRLAAAGAVSINLATQFAELPQEVQQAAIASVLENSEPVKEVMREAVKNYRAIGAGENEWYTPAEYADLARDVMGGIDLDPASCEQANEVIGASKFYTKDDDGLLKDWSGRVWLNPPYSRDLMPAFVEKLKNSFVDGSVQQAVLVSHNNTDTAWFHSLASVATAICFPKKRIKFYRGDEIASPTNGQAFFYLGDNADKFKSVFCDVGFVVRPV